MATYTYVTLQGWQIWRCTENEARTRAALLAGRAPYALMKDGKNRAELKALTVQGLSKLDELQKVLTTQTRPSYIEGQT